MKTHTGVTFKTLTFKNKQKPDYLTTYLIYRINIELEKNFNKVKMNYRWEI